MVFLDRLDALTVAKYLLSMLANRLCTSQTSKGGLDAANRIVPSAMTPKTVLLLFCFFLSLLSRSYAQAKDESVKLAELPSQYVCVVFTLDLNTSDFSKSTTRQEYHGVDGERWRLEVVAGPKKGFVATYDGKEVRGSNPKMNGAKVSDLQHIAPTSWFPMLFGSLKRTTIVAAAPASLESLTCERYTLKSETQSLEVWIHSETRLPIQVIARVSDDIAAIQRFSWVSQKVKLSEGDMTDMTTVFYRRFAESLNSKVTAAFPR